MKRDSVATAGWLVLGSPLALLVLLTVIGLVSGTSIGTLREQIGNESIREAVYLSLRTTLVSTAAIIAFGSCLAMGIARLPSRLASPLETLITIPAIMPPSVAGVALLLAFGRQGLIPTSLPFTTAAVILAQTFVATPFFVREAVSAFRSIDVSLTEAARLDGASTAGLARHIVIPLALPFLITGAILAWTRALGEFGATILFAGNLQGETQTMPLAIYLGFESNLDEAKALAVILLLCAVAVLGFLNLFLRRRMTLAH